MKTAERAVCVGIVVAIALVLRWAFVARGVVVDPLRADAGQYAQCAKNLVEHGVYSLSTQVPPPPDSVRSPGYPLFLAACRTVAGPSWQSLAVGLQVALGVWTVLVTYWLARRFMSFVWAISVAALCALSPHMVVAPAFVLTECLTAALLATGVWLFAAALADGVRWRGLAAAALLGLVPMCNEALVFVPFLAGLTWWRRAGVRQTLSLALVALAPLAAWTVRNQLVPLAGTGSDRLVASISHGSYPGMVLRSESLRGYAYLEDPEQPAFGASWTRLVEVLGKRFAESPWRYASWYLLEKPVWLWSWKFTQGHDVLVYQVGNSPYDLHDGMAATHTLIRWLHVPIMLCAALGALLSLLRHRSREPVLGLIGALAVATTLAYLPVVPDPRYLQAIRPLLFLLAMVTLSAGWAALRRAWPRRPATAVAASAES